MRTISSWNETTIHAYSKKQQITTSEGGTRRRVAPIHHGQVCVHRRGGCRPRRTGCTAARDHVERGEWGPPPSTKWPCADEKGARRGRGGVRRCWCRMGTIAYGVEDGRGRCRWCCLGTVAVGVRMREGCGVTGNCTWKGAGAACLNYLDVDTYQRPIGIKIGRYIIYRSNYWFVHPLRKYDIHVLCLEEGVTTPRE
jgi:hypothetical protein